MPHDDNRIVLERHSQATIDQASLSNPFAGACLDTGNTRINREDECTLGATSTNTDAHKNTTRTLSSPSLPHVDTQSSSHQTYPPAPTLPQHQSRINNTSLLYLPIKLKCGVTARCQPNVLVQCRQVLTDLNTDITQCLRVLPPSVHKLIKRTAIWINMEYSYGLLSNPKCIKHITTHHHVGWLVGVAGDNPQKATSIEVYSAVEYCRNRLHYNGAGLILHEYCHLIHQLVLPNGLDNARIVKLYDTMRKSGKYNNVHRRDWAGMDTERDMHYCTVNYKEMWAELSVTYLANGYGDIGVTCNASNAAMREFSPPFMSPDVIERVPKPQRSSSPPAYRSKFIEWIRRLIGQKETMKHCSKFYPFTSKQFTVHDPELYNGISSLWRDIAEWEDGEANAVCWGFPGISRT